MKKLLIMLTLMLGIGSATAQELSVNANYIQAMEHVGSDIKQGAGLSASMNFDFFKKKAFNFGPSFTYYKFGEVASDMESLVSDEEIGVGLHAGVDIKSVALDFGLELPLSPGNKSESAFFESMLSAKLKFLPSKGKGIGFQTGMDYFINKHLFHYTYQFNGGLFYRF